MSEIGITNSQWYQDIADAIRQKRSGSTNVGEKTITENGVYIAAEEEDGAGHNLGYYGYNKVTVNVPEGVIGIDPEDDNEHMITVDPITDELIDTLLPSSIDVVTPPTKLIYEDGETIDLTGAVIKAYTADGQLWANEDYPNGIIPNAELTTEPDKADAEEAKGGAQEINAIWNRPHDDKELKTNFEIEVSGGGVYLPYNCDVGDFLFDAIPLGLNRIFFKDGTGKAYYKVIDAINTSGHGYDYYREPLVIGTTPESVKIIVKKDNGDIDFIISSTNFVTYEGTKFYYNATYGVPSDGSYPQMLIPDDITSLLQEIGAHGEEPEGDE